LATADDWAEPRWIEYRKHLPPNPERKKWAQVVKETAQPGHTSYYHPDMLGQIDRLELACQTDGLLLAERGPVRYYWCQFDGVIGASRGVETAFLLVEHHITGDLHGHPVTWDELKKKGARDEDRRIPRPT